MLTDATGLPLAVATSAANTHDSLALIPLVQAIPAIRSRRGPRRRRPDKLHADKGYDYPHLRAWLRRRRITPRIARRGIETSERLGRHRWVVERSLAWLPDSRRLTLTTRFRTTEAGGSRSGRRPAGAVRGGCRRGVHTGCAAA